MNPSPTLAPKALGLLIPKGIFVLNSSIITIATNPIFLIIPDLIISPQNEDNGLIG